MEVKEKKRVFLKEAADSEVVEKPAEDVRTLLKESSSKSAQPLEIPGLPERFEAIRLLGQGGMGTVYQIRDAALESDFAIKFMSEQSLPDETARQRFKIEAAAVHELVHPNIVQVYDYSINDSASYIVMEYVAGSSFDRVLARERIIEQQRLLNMMLQICDALSHAHLHGVVHRDLKPSNIILHESSDLIKLVDFGIAKVGPQNESATQLTQKGEVFGSPAYMSPEQARAGKIDHRTDLYSLGCIMYEGLSGRPLFAGQNAIEILLQHINSSPLTQTRKLLKKGYSKSLVAVIEKLLEKEPDKRYQSAAELAEDLRRVIDNQLSFALIKKPFLISVSKNAVVATLAGSCLLGMLGLCAYTTVTVMQLKNGPSETRVFDTMVSKRNQAKELIDRAMNGSVEEKKLALRALRLQVPTPGSNDEGSRLTELLEPKDQLSLVTAFNNETSPEIRKEILETLDSVTQPDPALIAFASKVSAGNDEILKPLAASCLCSWVVNCKKENQPALSTALSELFLRLSSEEEGPSSANSNLQSRIATVLGNLSNFSDEAVKNIRESAKMVHADKIDTYYGRNVHPLVSLANIKSTYYPELTMLLKKKSERRTVFGALASLGPKALPAVPALLKLMRSAPLEDPTNSVYHTLGAIGPAAANEVVPALKANFSRHRTQELASIAAALAKMGPLGIAALQEEANRKRLPYNPDLHSPDYLHNAAIDAAKDALAAQGEN